MKVPTCVQDTTQEETDDLEMFYSQQLGVNVSNSYPGLRCIKQQIFYLKNRNRMPLNVNAMQQWQENSLVNPELYKLACVLLAVPTSQVSVERAFSALACVLTNRRTRIGKENLENILLVKLNYALIDKVVFDI